MVVRVWQLCSEGVRGGRATVCIAVVVRRLETCMIYPTPADLTPPSQWQVGSLLHFAILNWVVLY